MPGRSIFSPDAPAPIGPYSQAVAAQRLLFISGQLPVDPATGAMPQAIEDQTRQALENLRAVIEAAGGSLRDVVKTTVYLACLDDFAAMNQVYGEFFVEEPPARACVEVSRLPRGALIEVEAIALLPTGG